MKKNKFFKLFALFGISIPLLAGCTGLLPKTSSKEEETSSEIEEQTSIHSSKEQASSSSSSSTYSIPSTYSSSSSSTYSSPSTYSSEEQPPVNYYVVTWLDYDGTVLEIDERVEEGSMPIYNGATPERENTPQYRYTFTNWSPTISPVYSDVTYTAVYESAVNTYTITWLNSDGSVLKVDADVAYGTMPSFTGSTPTLSSTAQYNYTFSGWSPALSEVTGDVTYTATYAREIRKYTVTWVDDNGVALEIDNDVPYGTMPTYDGATPQKASTAQSVFTFNRWSPTVKEVTKDITYTATFSEEVRKYTITWKNYNGSILEVDNAPYGSVPAYDGETPTKKGDSTYDYQFIGWQGLDATVTGDAIYYAQFEQTLKLFTYVVYSETTCSVSGFTSETMTDVVIPSTIDGLEVVAIDPHAFENCTNIVNVTIPSGVTVIWDYAFKGCTNLKSISIPEGVDSIRYQGFYGCSSLEKIVLPSSVQSIAREAFYGCTSLQYIIFPSLTGVGSNAFDNCDSLTAGYFLGTKEQFNAIQFSDDSLNKNATVYYYSDQEPLDNDDYWHYVEGLPSQWPIGSYLTYSNYQSYDSLISGLAVTGCKNEQLESITIPDYYNGKPVVAIFSSAFCNCVNLKRISIPSTIKAIDEGSFTCCRKLEYTQEDGVNYLGNKDNPYVYAASLIDINSTSITLKDGCRVFSSYLFQDSRVTSVTLPEGITHIGDEAFKFCHDLTSISIPDSVVSIGYRAFWNCDRLTSFTISKNVSYLGTSFVGACHGLSEIIIDPLNNKFSYSNGLLCERETSEIVTCLPTFSGELIIPNGVTSIRSEAFEGCRSITSFAVPSSVNYFDVKMIYNMGLLTSFVIDPANETYCSIDGILYSKDATKLISCPPNIVNKNVVIPNTVEIIGYESFLCCGIRSVSVPQSVTTIERRAFYGCGGLETINIPSTVSSIGEKAFDYCSSLSNLSVDANNKFYHQSNGFLFDLATGDVIVCTLLDEENVSIPEGVTSINSSLLSNCTNLRQLFIPSSVSHIESAFLNPSNYDNLQSITIDENNQYYCVVDNIIYNKEMTELVRCLKIKTSEVNIPNTVVSIGLYAFMDCKQITSVIIPDSTTSIGYFSFRNCTGLTSIIIPSSVISIDMQAFEGCTSLEWVVLSPLDYIGTNVFSDCSALQTVYFYGTYNQYSSINIAIKNDVLFHTTIAFYSKISPTDESVCWHYVDGVPTLWN